MSMIGLAEQSRLPCTLECCKSAVILEAFFLRDYKDKTGMTMTQICDNHPKPQVYFYEVMKIQNQDSI